jgi:hypothetical protein
MQDHPESQSSYANQIDWVMYSIEFHGIGVPHIHLAYTLIDDSDFTEKMITVRNMQGTQSITKRT